MLAKATIALAGSLSLASAQAAKGFNWASNGNTEASFTTEFTDQAKLPGASGFNSARLYTMIQDGTKDTPISAIPAAISTKSTLLLGLWASAGQEAFNNELTALRSAIAQYGQEFANTVVGISVGSEDLYRDTYTSQVVNKDPNPGASPDTLVDYIDQVRDLIKGTSLAAKPVGHVDTYTAYINGSNQALNDAVDFCGMDAYPYYQTTVANSIDNAYDLFYSAYDQTQSACGGKPVWVTETGWPYSGKKSNDAVASVENAERYWKEVGCSLFGKTNVWWFTLADGGSDPAFGILGDSLDNEPLFDLSCSKTSSSSSSTKASSTKASSTKATSAAGSQAASTTSSAETETVTSSSEGSKTTSKASTVEVTGSTTGVSTSRAASGSAPAGTGAPGTGVAPPAGTGSAGGPGGPAGTGSGATSPVPASPSSTLFPGAAIRTEVGSFGAALLALAAYLL